MGVQPDQRPLLYVLSHRPLSLPRTQTSIIPLGGAAAAGDDVSSPPSGCQPVQELPPFAVYCHHSWPSVPFAKRSRRPEPHEEAAGIVLTGIWPPREVQPLHELPLFLVVRCQMAPSVPRTKTSMRLLPGAVAATADDVSLPPSDCQLDQDVPVYHCRHSWPSVPCAKRSRRPEPHEQTVASVPAGIWPPREVQPLQEAPPFVVVFSQMALSLPRTKTSIRPLPGAAAAGSDVRMPPMDADTIQVVPVQFFHQRALSLPRKKRSRVFAFCADTAGAPATPT